MFVQQMQQILEALQQTQTKIQAIKTENDELQVQIVASAANKSPSLTTSEETEETLKSLVKALVKDGKKAKIPTPHNWSGEKKSLESFHRECEMWLDKKNNTRPDGASPSSLDT